jgi:hypothetical protein
MALFIMRSSEADGSMMRERLPGNYDYDQQAEEALAQILAGYKSCGRNNYYNYWWERDNGDREFKFVISGTTLIPASHV